MMGNPRRLRMKKILVWPIQRPACDSQPVFWPDRLARLLNPVSTHSRHVLSLSWRGLLMIFVTGIFVTGLVGCSSGSSTPSGQGPHPEQSAAWFAQTRNMDALQAQLKWCAKNNPQMSISSCAVAKKGYALIGGQWNQNVINMFKAGH